MGASLRVRLVASLLGLVLALVGLGAWSAWHLWEMGEVAERILADNYLSVEAAQQLLFPLRPRMLEVGDDGLADLEVGQKLQRRPGVLARDGVDFPEDAERARREILEIPDRRRDDVERPRHAPIV